jgi:hypothetical protein
MTRATSLSLSPQRHVTNSEVQPCAYRTSPSPHTPNPHSTRDHVTSPAPAVSLIALHIVRSASASSITWLTPRSASRSRSLPGFDLEGDSWQRFPDGIPRAAKCRRESQMSRPSTLVGLSSTLPGNDEADHLRRATLYPERTPLAQCHLAFSSQMPSLGRRGANKALAPHTSPELGRGWIHPGLSQPLTLATLRATRWAPLAMCNMVREHCPSSSLPATKLHFSHRPVLGPYMASVVAVPSVAPLHPPPFEAHTARGDTISFSAVGARACSSRAR